MYHPVKMRCLQDSSTCGRATQQVQRPTAVHLTLCKAKLGERSIQRCSSAYTQ